MWVTPNNGCPPLRKSMGRDKTYDQYKKHKSPKLKGLRHWAEFIALRGLEGFARLFSLRQNQAWGRAFGRLAFKLAKKDQGIALYQLKFALPHLTEAEQRDLARQSFENVGQTLFETLVIHRFRQNPSQWIHLENESLVHKALAQGKGAIFIFGHLGNWELLPLVYEMLGIEGFAIESPIGEDKLDDLLAKKRASKNITMIPRGDAKAAKSILSNFRSNRVMLFALDQDMKVKGHFVDFFGKKAATAKGAAHLAVKFSAPVIGAFGLRQQEGTHQYRFVPLSSPPYQGGELEEISLTQSYTQAIEAQIRQDLSQWVWFHRRWKTRPQEEG